jgi:chromosome segregation ATPase
MMGKEFAVSLDELRSRFDQWVVNSQDVVARVIPDLFRACEDQARRAEAAEAQVAGASHEVERLRADLAGLQAEVTRLHEASREIHEQAEHLVDHCDGVARDLSARVDQLRRLVIRAAPEDAIVVELPWSPDRGARVEGGPS